MKNIRNDLLNYKWFTLSSFKFDDFQDTINVPGGEKKLKFFHDVHEKDALLESNLGKVPKLNRKVLHPGNYKQNVPAALAIFHETNASAFQTYFSDGSSTAKFLILFRLWTLTLNSKSIFSTNKYFKDTVVNGDQKTPFL